MLSPTPPKELNELKHLLENYTDYSLYNWYTSETGPQFHLTLGKWGERFHITYQDKTHYSIEVGKVYENGLSWHDITEHVLNNNEHDMKKIYDEVRDESENHSRHAPV